MENENIDQNLEEGVDNTTGEATQKKGRGFASMDEDKQREIASKGGKAAHEKGTAHEFDSAEGQAAGRKGGQARQQNAAENTDTPGTDLIDDLDS
jgi:general stress protein YciG